MVIQIWNIIIVFPSEVHADTGLINLDDLGNDLQQLIVDDNQRFEEELKQWDEQVQQRRQQQLQQQLQQVRQNNMCTPKLPDCFHDHMFENSRE